MCVVCVLFFFLLLLCLGGILCSVEGKRADKKPHINFGRAKMELSCGERGGVMLMNMLQDTFMSFALHVYVFSV